MGGSQYWLNLIPLLKMEIDIKSLPIKPVDDTKTDRMINYDRLRAGKAARAGLGNKQDMLQYAYENGILENGRFVKDFDQTTKC